MRKPQGQSGSQVAQKRFRFSKEKIEALPAPQDGPAVFYDADVKGLCLRVQPSGKKLFFVLKKVAGKTYRRSLSTHPNMSVENARKHALKLLAAVADWVAGDRKDPNPILRPLPDSEEGPMTFQSAFEKYLRAPLRGEGKRFVNHEKADARRWYIFNHCLKPLAGRPIDEFTPALVDNYHKNLTKKFGPIMANRAHEVLRATFNLLIKKGLWTTVNPSVGATRAPKHDRARILEDDELKPFYDALDKEENVDFAEFLALLLTTGVRVSNLYSAEWAEVKENDRTWTIPAEKSKNGYAMLIKLRPEAVQLFKRRRERRSPGDPWVFPSKFASENGERMHVQDYKNQFTRVKAVAGLLAGVTCCERAKKLFKDTDKPHTKRTTEGEIRCAECGKQNFTFHDLRRTFVANLVMANVPLPIASEAAGHRNLSSMGPYGRFAKGQVAKALDQGAEHEKRRMEEAEARKLLSA